MTIIQRVVRDNAWRCSGVVTQLIRFVKLLNTGCCSLSEGILSDQTRLVRLLHLEVSRGSLKMDDPLLIDNFLLCHVGWCLWSYTWFFGMEVHGFLDWVWGSKARLHIQVIRLGLWRLSAHKTDARHFHYRSLDIQHDIVILTTSWGWYHARIIANSITVMIFLSAKRWLGMRCHPDWDGIDLDRACWSLVSRVVGPFLHDCYLWLGPICPSSNECTFMEWYSFCTKRFL